MLPSPPSDGAGPSIAQARNSRAVATADKLHMNHTAIITEKHPAGPRRLMLVMFVALSFAFTWPTGANAEVPVTSLSTSPMHKPLPLGAPTSERVELLCWGNAELGQTPQQIPHAAYAVPGDGAHRRLSPCDGAIPANAEKRANFAMVIVRGTLPAATSVALRRGERTYRSLRRLSRAIRWGAVAAAAWDRWALFDAPVEHEPRRASSAASGGSVYGPVALVIGFFDLLFPVKRILDQVVVRIGFVERVLDEIVASVRLVQRISDQVVWGGGYCCCGDHVFYAYDRWAGMARPCEECGNRRACLGWAVDLRHPQHPLRLCSRRSV